MVFMAKIILVNKNSKFVILNHIVKKSWKWNVRPVKEESPGQHQLGHLMADPCHPIRESDFVITNLSLLAYITSLFPLPSSYKSLSYCTTLWCSFLLDWILLDSNKLKQI